MVGGRERISNQVLQEGLLVSRKQLQQLLPVGTRDPDGCILQPLSGLANGFPNPGPFEDSLNRGNRAQVFHGKPKKVRIRDHRQKKRFDISRQIVRKRAGF
jgi:hypothetical protein